MTTPKKRRKIAATASKKNAATSSEICFCIMPFGGYFDDYFESIFQPAIEEAGLISKRADDLYRPSTIVNDIWHYTQQAKIILADLTGKNPNVFYELGLAHALAKPAILVTNQMEDVPFDLRALRVIEYDKNDPNWGQVLHQKIVRSINEVKQAPLESVLPTFLKVEKGAQQKPVTVEDKIILELRQDIEVLRNEMRRIDSPRDLPRPILEPKEAEQLIKRYLKMKLPDSLIVDRVTQRGAPRSWVRDKIAEFSGTAELISEEDS